MMHSRMCREEGKGTCGNMLLLRGQCLHDREGARPGVQVISPRALRGVAKSSGTMAG